VVDGLQDPEDMKPMPPQDFTEITPKPEIGVVLASFDMHFNYKKMSKAFNYLANNEGCVLLLSNDDAQVPLHHGATAAGGLPAASNMSIRGSKLIFMLRRQARGL
jgi:4-nitrophenyl phosphatase